MMHTSTAHAPGSTQSVPVAATWFDATRLDGNITRVREHHVDSYAIGDIWLIEGRDQSIAVDAGSGIAQPGPYVEGLVDSPVLAVALTCSYDHAGGWHTFQRRACHPLDADALADPSVENAEIHLYLTADRFAALPHADFTLEGFAMAGAHPTETLADHDTIDLGDRRLEVLHTPGRSPGGVSLWEAATGTLFSGEILYDGDHGPAWPPDDVPSYCTSLRRLRELPVQIVHPGHYGSFGGDRMRTLIDEQLADLSNA